MTPRPNRFPPPALLIATCGGIGWIPWAPGTFGSLAGIPLALVTGMTATLLADASGLQEPVLGVVVALVEVAIIAVLFAVSVPVASRAAALLMRKDPGPVVIDEVIAVPLVLVVVPSSARGWPLLLAGFILFRIFDISKPQPCRMLERLPAGLGIMADDQAAAIYGAICLAAARWQGWV